MNKILIVLLILFTTLSCALGETVITPSVTIIPTTTPNPILSTASPALKAQPYRPQADLGPDEFPADINSLTGLNSIEPSLLNFPAVLVSISNSPASARPQAGPGFAAWVFELFIGEGATRFMNVFYGEFPRNVPNINGGCELNEEIQYVQEPWIGNRVWLDENENGVQDDWELGVGGVCVRLLDAASLEVLNETSTDSNGYFAFQSPEHDVILEFEKPLAYRFTIPNIGFEDSDSDADQVTGRTAIVPAHTDASSMDAGLILLSGLVATPDPASTPVPTYIPSEPYAGPIRSGRLTYNQIGAMFPNSCLIYASAAWDIGEQLDACEIVYGVDATTPNSALLSTMRLRELAVDNVNQNQPVNYTGNLFSSSPLEGGKPAFEISMYYHQFNQSAWKYDPVSGSYLRFTDDADGKGLLHPATDRLTGRQLSFENVIIVLADHMRFRHNQFEVDFSTGHAGFAYLFRDGQIYKIRWSTANRDYEKTNGLRRPMHFLDDQGKLIPLHPGRTWIHIVTPFSSIQEMESANWVVKFVQPYDPPDTPAP